ncbi:MAG: fibronectin type III domain-containing protein, partial [Thermoplasmata archaeon]|nr:fibronectin type III domain-containing protein [Thermoplasmata archaeon]
VTGYVVLKGASPTSMEVVATLGSVTSWTDLDVEQGKTYHYSVYALNVAVAGEPSDVVMVKVPEEVSVASGLSSMYILAIVLVLVLIVITAFIILRRDLV